MQERGERIESIGLALSAAAWALASAVAVIALGALTLLGGRSRPRGAFAFGLFCVLWGLQIALGQIGGLVGDQGLAQALYLFNLVALLATPYFLVEFAASRLEANASKMWFVLRICAASIAAFSALVLVLDPSLLFQGTTVLGARYFPAWGALYIPLVVAPHFASFGVALVALLREKRRAPTPRTDERASVLLAGLSLYLAFAAGNNLVFYFAQSLTYGLTQTRAVYIALFAALSALVTVAGIVAMRRVKSASTSADMRRERWLAASILIPLVWGALEAGLASTIIPSELDTVGLWRLAGVAVIAYGLARWRFYDLPQRTTRAAAAASGTTAATAGAAAAYGATTLATSETAIPILAGLLVLSAAIIPSVRFARKLFGVSEVRTQKADDQLYGQRIDAYRAALEASLARDSLNEDREFLAALRERFGITEAEERVLLHYARSSVIVARSDKAFDAFERLRLLGEGGGGRTWLARDRARDRLVVLKEPLDKHHADPEMRENVLREARLAARVRHPNVVNVEQVVESKGAPVIVMEYLEGGSLADVLRARGTLPWREAVELALGVLRGVEAVHAAGIIHRDVKPSNVLIGAEGAPKVADFGVAVPATGGATIVEGSSTFAGTLSYIAPEVRHGGKPADRRSDVYACAALLHECLHGAPPGRTAVIVHNDVPPALSAALARGLADDPDARYPTARAFAEDLARALR